LTLATLQKLSKEYVTVYCQSKEFKSVLCHLGKDLPQVKLDLYFGDSEEYYFEISGKTNVTLSGYYIDIDLDEDLEVDDEIVGDEELKEEELNNLKKKEIKTKNKKNYKENQLF